MEPQEAQSTSHVSLAAGPRVSRVAARLDRIPVLARHWRLVLLGQFMWGSVLLLDTLAARVYPVYWGPAHSFSQTQYTILVGAATGAGPLLGGILFGYLADLYGRKRMMIVSCAVAGLAGWPAGVVTSWSVLMPCVFVSALGIGGALAIVPSYNSEWCPPASRNRLMLGSQVLSQAMLQFLGIGLALWLLPHHVLAFVFVLAGVPLATIPLIMFTMPESARWLEDKRRFGEADRIVSRMEALAVAKHGELVEPDYDAHRVVEGEKVRMTDVFRKPYLRRTLLILTVWLFFYFGPGGGFTPFQGIYIVSKGFSASQLFTILLIGGVGGVAGVFLASVLNERVERRALILISALVFGVGVALYFVDGRSYGVLVVGSILVSGGFGVMLNNLYNYSAAIFPTRMRSVGTGWADGVGHMSAVFGPIIAGVWYTATAGANHVGWFLWFLVVGTLTPALILYRFGGNQRRVPLEKVSR
jgi:putative MFS transporter